MIKSICVVGFPGRGGGADQELFHQINLWLDMGLNIEIIPTLPLDEYQKSLPLQSRGVIIHPLRKWTECQDKDVISYCNGTFLEAIQTVRQYARTITWSNTMTFAFPRETQASYRGDIDFYLYQSDHAMKRIEAVIGPPVRPHGQAVRVDPYFDASLFPFREPTESNVFRVGRMSRIDISKYSPQTLNIYRQIRHEKKQALIMGWGPTIEHHCGKPDPWMKCLPMNAMTQQEFYAGIDAYVASCTGLENLPRVGMEAAASGVPLVVDNRGGWCELVEHGVTGYLANSPGEMADYATKLADHKQRVLFAHAASARLDKRWGRSPAMDSWAKFFELVRKVK